MKISKQELQALLICSSDDQTRYQLASVHVDGGRKKLVATDGMIMLTVAKPDTPDSFVEGFILEAGETSGPAPNTVRGLLKLLDANREVDFELRAEESSGRPVAAFNGIEAALADVEGRYPDYERVMPTKSPKDSVMLSLAVLTRIVKAAKALGATHLGLETRGHKLPVVMTLSSDGVKAVGAQPKPAELQENLGQLVVMPVVRNRGAA